MSGTIYHHDHWFLNVVVIVYSQLMIEKGISETLYAHPTADLRQD
jgi:hypothetical protein